jgi:uncharacterized protein YbbK (DUF523 family)
LESEEKSRKKKEFPLCPEVNNGLTAPTWTERTTAQRHYVMIFYTELNQNW